jgi:hypothetical protein
MRRSEPECIRGRKTESIDGSVAFNRLGSTANLLTHARLVKIRPVYVGSP